MVSKKKEIGRKRLVKKAKSLGTVYAERLSNKSLSKIVNINNISKRLTKIFNRLEKRTVFTNSELDKAIELYGLKIDDLKEIAKRREINNYGNMSKYKLYYALVKSEKSPLESSHLKHLEYTTTSDFKKRLNPIKVLTNRLDNKLTNVERSKLYEKINELKKEYVKTNNKNIREKVTQEVVDITNNLYNIQKQHTKLQHDQAYHGLRDIKNLFNVNDNIYEPIFVKSAVKKKRFEEYEISGNRNMISMREYVTTIYSSLKSLIDKKQQSMDDEQKNNA